MNWQERLAALGTATALLLAAVAWKPYYNWDMVAYIGAVYARSHSDVQTVHSLAYDEVKRHSPAFRYAILIGQESPNQNPWRTVLADNPRAFTQFLPAFQVKPAYPLLMSALKMTGMDLVTASVVLSKVAYWLIGLLVFYWLSLYLRPWAACLCAVPIMLTPPAANLACLSSPDALSTLVTLAVLFLLTERASMYRAALLLALLALLVRHNNLLLLFLSAVLITWRTPKLRITTLTCCTGGLAIFLAMKNIYGNFGWETFFYHSAVEKLIFPAEFESPLSLRDYVHVYLGYARSATTFATLWWWLLLGLPLLYSRWRRGGLDDLWLQTVFTCLTMILVLWLALPSPSPNAATRLFMPSYLSILICLAATASAGTVLARVPASPGRG